MTDPEGQSVWFWEGNASGEAAHSITRYVEENSDRIRGKYLSFIHDLGQTVFEGKRLVEHLELKPGFSFWWMSLLAEKSLYKSPAITDCCKLIGLEEIIRERKLKQIRILGIKDPKVVVAIRSLCRNIGIGFSTDKIHRELKRNWKYLYNRLPYFLQGMIWLVRHVVSRWPLRRAKAPDWFSGGNTIFFMSYFAHLDKRACSSGQFKSGLWGIFPKECREEGFQCNWLHHYLSSQAVPDPKAAIDYVNRLNDNSCKQGKHSTLDSYISVPIISKAIVNWLKISWRTFRISKPERAFRATDSAVCLWPLLKDDWHKSFHGPQAMQNALWAELFEVVLGNLPKQQLGLYLYEGQGWERAFIDAWRKNGHGEQIAVAHSTVRYWDFRYFNDSRTIINEGPLAMPSSDYVAVNGPVARQALIDSGFPNKRILDVEALRYLNLAELASKRNNAFDDSEPKSKRRLLVLGDIMASYTHDVMRTLEDLPREVQNQYEITVKPHPANPVDKANYPSINFKIVRNPLPEIFDQFDFVYGANPTSANLDAYLAGLPIIIHQTEGQLNFSPLRGVDGVLFVRDHKELAAALKNFKGVNDTIEEFFWLDDKLPKWKRLIKRKVIVN